MSPIALPVASASSAAASDEAEEIAYKAAQNRSERMAAFSLVYQAYLRTGLITPNPSQMRVTPHQLQPGSDIFIAALQGVIISTVSLIPDGPLGLPMESIYGKEVASLRALGLSVAEVSSLADRRRRMTRTLPVFVQLMRLMVQSAYRRGVDRLLVVVHPRHARFYQRFLSFESLGDVRSYPEVCNKPAAALFLDFARIGRDRPPNYELFFGKPFAEEQFQRHPISSADAEHFAAAAVFSKQFWATESDEQPIAQRRVV